MEMEQVLRACVSLGRSYGFDEAHSVQDARIALRLFDLLLEAHKLPEEARDVLHSAALLHDIGYCEGYGSHHKAAYRLIMEANLPALTRRERLLVANVARYHRGARPDSTHQGFSLLDADERNMVLLLGAILRLADGLDRSHCNAVRGIDVRSVGDRLVVFVDCPQGCEPEVQAGEKKGRLLAEVLGVRLEVRESPEAGSG